MDHLRRDLAFAVRMLLKHPGISLIVVLTLGIGIGLTTMVFSMINGAMYKGLPFPDGDRVMIVGTAEPARDVRFGTVGVHDFVEWREQQTTFYELAGFNIRTVNLAASEGRPERYTATITTANLFDVIRVSPILGRGFQAGDDRPGAEPVIIIGHDVWQNRFGGSPAAIGATVRANGEIRTIVGVAPEGFAFPDREQLWIPLELDPNATARGEGMELFAMGRLRDGVSLDQARAELATIARRIEREYPATNEGVSATAMSFSQLVVGPEFAGMIYTMLAAALGVLLIACANVANLLLARASVRTREVAVRNALGANRSRIIAQLMTEVLILSVIGGVLGVALGHVGITWFDRVTNIEPPPFWITFGFDHRVVLFVIATVLLSCLISGLVPALRASRLNINEALKDEARGSSSLRIGKLSGGLVVTEIALSCGLLILAGLMIRSIVELKGQDLPFATENVFTARLVLPEEDYPDAESRIRFYEELLPKVRAIPGVEAATLSDGLPAAGNGTRVIQIEGASYATEEDYPAPREGIVTPGYFETFDVSVLQGRAFTDMDRRESPPVAVVNESFVRSFYPDGDALGRRLRMVLADGPSEWMTVVGVVPDMKMEGIDNFQASPAGYYIPIAQSPIGTSVRIAIRTRGAPLAITSDVRTAVESLDRNLPIYEVLSMTDVIAKETWFFWIFGYVFMALGFIALMMGMIGLYGVMSFAVNRRTQEMGIRMALGADAPSLVRLVMRRGAAQMGLGIVLGIGIAALAASPLAVLLYRGDPRDPAVFGLVVLALALTGALASYVPARRVTKVDPVTALTSE
ncbi:MAG: FtsX-like permease family protein [Gemmatimonadetes bacterium]|nr:FtsX-like permease family protein [Gemmatimonadota bacterium]NIO31472.1 FtsX-like permease family protein [Gemmatimonadota bacterium]